MSFTGTIEKYKKLCIKREKRLANKKRIVENIIEDLKANIHDSEDYIFDLVRESLFRRTNKELLNKN